MKNAIRSIGGGILLAAALAGCESGTGTYVIDLNGITIEVESAARLHIPKGNDSTMTGWKVEIKGQEPIHIQAGGQERSFYSTEGRIHIGRGGTVETHDVPKGGRVILASDGTLMFAQAPGEASATPPPPAEGTPPPAESAPPAGGAGGGGSGGGSN